MRIKTVISLLSILLVIFAVGCESPTESTEGETITISGSVVEYNSGDPIEDAIIRVSDPETIATSDSLGQFSLSMTIDSTLSLEIVTSKEGFSPDTSNVLAVPDRDIGMPTIRLQSTEEITAASGEAASIFLSAKSAEAIVVRGSGALETSELTFIVKDSAGKAIDLSHAVTVGFRLGAHPDGGESLYPATVKTDGKGEATVTVSSGTKAGIVQIIAEITVGDNTIQSQPAGIVIHGGLPDADHFGIAIEYLNFPGYNIMGLTNQVTVICGDQYGNFATPGTPVYFTTDGGSIEGSSALDERGTAVVTLLSNNPRPSHPTLGVGFGTITAQTADQTGNAIETQTTVLFSGYPVIDISEILDMNVDMQNLGAYTFAYKVSDQNGNPLAPGTEIKVEITGPNLTLNGDVEIQLPDTQAKGAGTTDFQFTITDTNTDPIGSTVVIVISASGPNGDAQQTLQFSPTGTTPVSGDVAGPSSILLESISANAIYVAEGGLLENAQLVFQILDSLGRPLNSNNPVDVNFSLAAGPGGAEYLHPETVTTDGFGKATTSLQSGTQAGVVQVLAEIEYGDRTIRSKPVSVVIHGGLPDANHFTLAKQFHNFAGYNIAGLTNTITAYIGDKYGNVAAPGSAVYFTTDGGYIEGSALTDNMGIASVQLISGFPQPSHATLGPGFAVVTASTVDENHTTIQAEALVLFSGYPVLSVEPTTVNIPNGGSQEFTYEVHDQNNNPLAPGTSIKVEVNGDNVSSIGDVSITMPDTQARGYGSTQFSFTLYDTDEENVITKPVIVIISSDGPNGSGKIKISGNTAK